MHLYQPSHNEQDEGTIIDNVDAKFLALFETVQNCRACPKLDDAVRVLGWANGSPSAQIMFIGEAPGRLGADRTAIPFHGDKAGDNFESLLRVAGFSRSDIYVTNSALCNPRDEKGNNRPPASSEIQNCSKHLREQIRLLNPKIVCTLGGAALKATNIIEAHNLELSTDVRTAHHWFGRILIPLYHPGQRAMIHRNFSLQVSDYYFVAESLNRKRPAVKKFNRPLKEEIEDIIIEVLQAREEISLFGAHKILFLYEYNLRKEGKSLGINFIRQKDGPYCLELARVKFDPRKLTLTFKSSKPFITLKQKTAPTLFDEAPAILENKINLIEKYVCMSDSELKTAAYMTEPMRKILREEKSGVSRRNSLVLPPSTPPSS